MVKLLLHAGSDPNMRHPKEGSPMLQVRTLFTTPYTCSRVGFVWLSLCTLPSW